MTPYSPPHLMTGPARHGLQEGTSDHKQEHSISNDDIEAHKTIEMHGASVPHITHMAVITYRQGQGEKFSVTMPLSLSV